MNVKIKNLYIVVLLSAACLFSVSCTTDAGSTANKKVNSQSFVDFTLSDLKGKRHSLEDYRGRLLLVNFWATWCAPCIAELPSLQKLSESFPEEVFSVVTINIDSQSSLPEVEKLQKRLGLSFDILLDPELSIPPKLGITGFPETFFVDGQGQMVEFFDPVEKKKTIRVISDRDWSSPEIKQSIEAILKK